MEKRAVFIYTPRCVDENSPVPPSPTSSLKAVFGASRPASYAASECPTIASDCPTILPFTSDSSGYSSDASSPATSHAEHAIFTSFKPRPPQQTMAPPRLIHEDELYDRLTKPRIIPENEYYARLVAARSPTITLEKALMSRPTHVYADTPPIKKFSTHTSFDPKVVYRIPNPVRMVRRSDATSDKPLPPVPGPEEVYDPVGRSKKSNWRAVRRTVSHILHRHPKLPTPTSSLTPNSSSSITSASTTSPRALKPSKSVSLKSSSASLFSKPSCHSDKPLTITPAPRVFDEQQAQAYARKQQVRRSRSFSGYPNILVPIVDECIDDEDEDEDECLKEAREVMRGIQKCWSFTPVVIDAPLDVDDPKLLAQDLLFERAVKGL